MAWGINYPQLFITQRNDVPVLNGWFQDQIPVLPKSEGYALRRGVEELLAAFVQIRSEELKIEPSVLADRKQIHDFAKWCEQGKNVEEHFLFADWRRESIGESLYAILKGKVAMSIDKEGKIHLQPVTED